MKIKDKGLFSVYKGLPKPMYVVTLTTFVNGVGQFVFPFLVLFLTQKLGFSTKDAGLFMTTASAVYIPGMLIGSKLADRYSRKEVMLIAQTGMSFCLFSCGFLGTSTTIPWVIMLALLFDGFCDPARSALMADLTNPENRQRCYSLTYLSHNLGYIIGPLIAGYLFYSAPSWIFLGNGMAGFISILLVLIFVKENKPDKETVETSLKSKDDDKAETGGMFKALKTRPRIVLLAIFSMFIRMAYSSILFGLPLLCTELFGSNGASLYGTLNSMNGLTVVIATTPLLAYLRKNHALTNVVIARCFFLGGFILLAFASGRWELILAAITYTLGEVIDATNAGYYIVNNTPITHRARFGAILPLIEGTGGAMAPMFSGFVAGAYGTRAIFVWGSLCCLIGLAGTFILRKTEKVKPPLSDLVNQEN